MNQHLKLLGYRMRDVVTGYEGVVESVSFDLYGCIQAAVRPEMQKDKPTEIPEGRWLDVKRLELVHGPVMAAPNFDLPEIGSADKPRIK